MKLLLCPQCHDIQALAPIERACACGYTYGRYEKDGLHATVTGGLVIGIENSGLTRALYCHSHTPEDQYTLACWLFPEPHRRITYGPQG